jgi:hypothetical protein
MSREVKIGMTDYSVFVFIPDSASTDGSGKTGLVAANLTVSGARMETDNDATVIDYTGSLNDLAALTTAHTDWGLKEISSTLAPGLYRLDIADAIFAAGAWSAVVYVMVTTSAAAATPIEFILIPQSPIDGVLLAPTTHTSAVIPTVSTLTGHTAQTGDSYAIVNSGTHGNAAIKGFVDDIGTAGAGLAAVPWNAAWDAEVQSEVQDAIEANHLDHLIAVADPGGVVANSSFWAKLHSKSATPAYTSYDNTTDSLEAAATNFDAIASSVSTIATAVATILTDTNELQTDWTNGGRLDLLIDAILDDTGTSGVVVAAASKTGYALSSTGMDAVTLPANIITASSIATGAIGAAELGSDVITDIWQGTALTEAYAADGATATPAQLLYMIWSALSQFDITSTTLTCRQLDGTTSSMVYTLDDATNPTSRTRSA